MIDTDLLVFLQQLGTSAGDRVHLDDSPQGGSLPAIVIRRSGGDQPQTLNGTKLFERSQFQITVLAHDHAQSYPIANAIKAALHGFRGVMGTTRVRDTRCVAFPEHQSDVVGDSKTRIVTSQFRFMHTEG